MTSHIHRKKPQAKNNTWSCSSSSYYLNTLSQQTNFAIKSTPIEERINSYEHKYQTCMQSRTLLTDWIKTNKEKGLPEPLTEGKKNIEMTYQFNFMRYTQFLTMIT